MQSSTSPLSTLQTRFGNSHLLLSPLKDKNDNHKTLLKLVSNCHNYTNAAAALTTTTTARTERDR